MDYQIFVSYRRDGSEALACLISERLKQGGFKTFYDVDSLRSGKFNEEIFNVIDSCSDVLVVLPQNGLDRCKNQDDWVRKEIAYSIKKNKNIIPIMMRNFEFPEELPAEINELRNFNGISANMEYFDAAFSKLLSMVSSSKLTNEEKVNQITSDTELRTELLSCLKEMQINNCAATKTNLATCYKRTKNNSLNEEIAELYLQAATLGYAPAQNELGNCYAVGLGVEKNLEKAFSWYMQSAEQGFCDAQYNLARFFEQQSAKLSFLWMKKAAEQSSDKALFKIGEYYEHGHGTKKDYSLSKKYYSEAENAGCLNAAKKQQKNIGYYDI